MSPALALTDTQRRMEGLRDKLRSGVRSMREDQVGVGRTLLEIQRSRNLLLLGATTFPIFCEMEGLSPVEARELTALAEAAESTPEVGERVVEARITPQKAAVVNELLKTPEIRKPGEDLLAFAETRSAKDLLREVKQRREDARLGEPSVCLVLQVSAEGRDDFRRCQTLVSRSLDRFASEGETLEKITDEYLQRHDPERKAKRLEVSDRSKAPLEDAGPERPPPGPVDSPRSRRVPAPELRALFRAAGDRCWVEGCPHEAFLQMAHRRPFRMNGSNLARNLLRLCRTHHAQFDAGLWWLTLRRDGEVVLLDKRGVRVGRLRPEAARFLIEVDRRGRAPP